MNRLEEIEARLKEIKGELETRKDLTIDQIDELNKEVESLRQEKVQIIEKKRAEAIGAFKVTDGIDLKGDEEAEKRAESLMKTNKTVITRSEQRAALLSSGKIAKPTAVDGIYDNTEGELGILSEVVVKNYAQNETVAHAYKKSNATASAHTEGNSPTESEDTYGVIKVQPTSVSLISYISRAIKRLTPLEYDAEVRSSATSALRTAAEEFIIGKIPTCADTDSNKLATAVTLKETAIGEKTLRNIVLGYKPGKRFNGIATLFLTRDNLIAFGEVRGTNEKKPVYEIIPDANNAGGIIKDSGLSVRYKIVDSLTNMLYGYLRAFELDTFGDFEVTVSEDYKFAEGLLAVRGEAWFGGSLTVSGAFEVISLTQAKAS